MRKNDARYEYEYLAEGAITKTINESRKKLSKKPIDDNSEPTTRIDHDNEGMGWNSLIVPGAYPVQLIHILVLGTFFFFFFFFFIRQCLELETRSTETVKTHKSKYNAPP